MQTVKELAGVLRGLHSLFDSYNATELNDCSNPDPANFKGSKLDSLTDRFAAVCILCIMVS